MKLSVYIDPTGQFMVIPRDNASANQTLWGDKPVDVIFVDTLSPEIEQGIVAATKNGWENPGTLGNVFSGILTAVYIAGVKAGMKKQARKDFQQKRTQG